MTRVASARGMASLLVVLLASLLAVSCGRDEVAAPGPDPDPDDEVRFIPVVVHVVHLGEPEGEGHNLSTARIERQIEILNEDYRRKPGTRGFNEHPDGGDSRIGFVLAKTDPHGAATTGINRIDSRVVDNPVPPNRLFDHYAHYGYWDPELYVNIWTQPFPESTIGIILGQATGPETDLPGSDLLLRGEPHQAEGILINSHHFGESDIASEYGLGRTLSHEMGHYLGLLHTWGGGDCAENDHCDDTPAVSSPVTACPAEPPIGCDGAPVMTGNYMNYTPDACMNIFTKDQIARMHYVLDNSPRRRLLSKSPGLAAP